jgi:hypothetical protein
MPVRVTPDQFVLTQEGITHILTGAKLTQAGPDPDALKLDMGQLEKEKDHPEQHNPEAVVKMLYELWEEHRQGGRMDADRPE